MSVGTVHFGLSVKLLIEVWVHQSLQTMTKRESITAGQTAMYIMPAVAGFDREDSNQGYTEAHYTITFAHKLADSAPATEEAYVKGTVLPNQETVMAKSYYTTINGVHEVKGEIALTPPERIGNVIEWAVDVQLTVSP